MVTLRKLIKEKGLTHEMVIDATGIHRNRFYLGLKFPVVFDQKEIRAISVATGIPMKAIKELKKM